MRVSDPNCKRFPDVCGEIACSQDPNSLVCQLPVNHEGEHDWVMIVDLSESGIKRSLEDSLTGAQKWKEGEQND